MSAVEQHHRQRRFDIVGQVYGRTVGHVQGKVRKDIPTRKLISHRVPPQCTA
jgi:hypothetical protein